MSGVIVKVAWIRDQNEPAGKPAMGRLNCECGQAPMTWLKPGPDIICQCGRRYTWEGWRKGVSSRSDTLTAYRVVFRDGSSYCTSMAEAITLSKAINYFEGREIDGRLCTDVEPCGEVLRE